MARWVLGLVVISAILCGATAVSQEPMRSPSSGLQTWPESAATPEFALRDVDGKLWTRSQFRGRVLVILFGFARCPDVCPAELSKIATVLKRLEPSAASRVQVAFVTLDPEHDTPTTLKSFLARFNRSFIGLRGTPAEVNDVAKKFSVQHARVPAADDYTVEHSTALFIFDTRGKLRFVGSADNSSEDFFHAVSSLTPESGRKD